MVDDWVAEMDVDITLGWCGRCGGCMYVSLSPVVVNIIRMTRLTVIRWVHLSAYTPTSVFYSI
jgi:hypothetical protein